MANHKAVGRPRLIEGKDCQRLGFSADAKTADEFRKIAEKMEISQSELFRIMFDLAKRFLGKP